MPGGTFFAAAWQQQQKSKAKDKSLAQIGNAAIGNAKPSILASCENESI
jgi:hypothetical protein